MKKILQLIPILLIVLIVSACQANPEQGVEGNDGAIENTKENGSDSVSEVPEEPEEDPDQEATVNEDESTSYDYEEQEVIARQIVDGEYDVIVETDNQGTRILFYEIDGEKYYKTIFVKNDKRLKIIDIKNDNGQIFNEII